MTLEDMSLKDKIFALRHCVAKAAGDVEYSVASELGDDKLSTLNKFNTICDNATELFIVGRINQLDFDQRVEAQVKYDSDLCEALSKFPEYKAEKNMGGR